MITKNLTIFTDHKKGKINKEIYGHFSEHLGRCIYQGIFVGEDSDIPNVNGMRTDVVDALRALSIPVLRWPGGCFADEYHWMNGIGPKEGRMKMINTHWGGVTEDNSFGTHEFMELCRQLDCEPYISGNVGSGTVRELSEWIEYITSDNVSPMADLRRANGQANAWHLKYLGIGNESWGCGGNMTPEYYGNLYRHYQTYCRNYGDNRLFKVACGPNADDYNWTEKLMQLLKPGLANAISMHFYTVPNGWEKKGFATEFTADNFYKTIKETLKIAPMIDRHLEIMDQYDPEHKIGLIVDEWGTWWDVEPGTNPGFLYQQNTMRDAIVAAINLNLFNAHSDRIVMANIAQVVNVLQSVILTDGAKMLKTPTYHVFDMYKSHQEAMLLESVLDDTVTAHDGISIPDISVSSSMAADGSVTLTISNANLEETYSISTTLQGSKAFAGCEATILTGAMDAYNTFENPSAVVTSAYDGVTLETKTADLQSAGCQNQSLQITMPACSIVTIKLK